MTDPARRLGGLALDVACPDCGVVWTDLDDLLASTGDARCGECLDQAGGDA